MRKDSNNFSMEQIMAIANSPVGQQLLAVLQQSDQKALDQAIAQASGGDFNQAKDTLSKVLSSPEIQELLKQLGG